MKFLLGIALFAALLASACTPERATARSVPAAPETEAAHYKLFAVPYKEASPPTLKREPLPFRLRARTSIVDKDGNEIRRAPEGQSIVGMTVSPNQEWVLLSLVDAEYAVTSGDGLKDIAKLPIYPDAPADATVFEWFILDDERLIGYAALPSLEPTDGLTASEVEGLPPRGTLAYLYTIATGEMTPVEIDDSVPQPFGISIDSYGNLVILPFSGLNYLGMKIISIPEP